MLDGTKCFRTSIENDMFMFEFGAINPDYTVKVKLHYYVSLTDDMILRLPLSFKPNYSLNPGKEMSHDTAARNGYKLTVLCPSGFKRVTDLRTGKDLQYKCEQFVLHEENELLVNLKFHPVSEDESSTDAVMFRLDHDVVSPESNLWNKVAIVLDKKVKVKYELMTCEIQFIIDMTKSLFESERNQIHLALIAELGRLLTLDNDFIVKIICLGQTMMMTKWWGVNSKFDAQLLQDATQWLEENMKLDYGRFAELNIMLRSVYQTGKAPLLSVPLPRQVILLTNAAPLNYDLEVETVRNGRSTDIFHNQTWTIGVDENVSMVYLNNEINILINILGPL